MGKTYKEKNNDIKQTAFIRSQIRRRAATGDIIKFHAQPQLGPKSMLYHYVFDLKWSVQDAIDEILKQFPSLDEEIAMKWIEEKREKGKILDDDGR